MSDLPQDALKPCPFCGNEPYRSPRAHNPKAYCVKDDCYGKRMSVVNLDDPVCVAMWNTRAPVSDLAITKAEIMAIGDTVTTLRKMGHSAFDVCRAIVEEVCALSAKPAPGDEYERAVHEIGVAIRDQINAAAASHCSEVTSAPSEIQIEEAILQFARERGRSINLTYDSGSYEITKPTGAAINFARAILALHASGASPRLCSCKASQRDGQHMAWCASLSRPQSGGVE